MENCKLAICSQSILLVIIRMSRNAIMDRNLLKILRADFFVSNYVMVSLDRTLRAIVVRHAGLVVRK